MQRYADGCQPVPLSAGYDLSSSFVSSLRIIGITESLQEKRQGNNQEKPPYRIGCSPGPPPFPEREEQTACRMRQAGMRPITRLFLFSLFLLAAGCSAPTPALTASPSSYQPGSPVVTTADAITVAGKQFVEMGGLQWIEPPQPVFTEEMSYADAQERIGVGEGEYNRWPRETRVWLVIFKGRWLLTPMGPGPSPTPIEYEGCVLTLFTARDGEWMAMGDAVCPVQ